MKLFTSTTPPPPHLLSCMSLSPTTVPPTHPSTKHPPLPFFFHPKPFSPFLGQQKGGFLRALWVTGGSENEEGSRGGVLGNASLFWSAFITPAGRFPEPRLRVRSRTPPFTPDTAGRRGRVIFAHSDWIRTLLFPRPPFPHFDTGQKKNEMLRDARSSLLGRTGVR